MDPGSRGVAAYVLAGEQPPAVDGSDLAGDTVDAAAGQVTEDSPQPIRRAISRRIDTAILVVALVAGAALRLIDLGRVGLNSDEAVYAAQSASLAAVESEQSSKTCLQARMQGSAQPARARSQRLIHS